MAGKQAGWLAVLGLVPCPVLSCSVLSIYGLDCRAGPFLQLAAAGPVSYFARLRNLGTELPYGSSMAYGRCGMVPLQHLPTSPQQSPG